MRFSLIINGIVADLFSDETISLTRQVKDFTKIETIFTDYTQSFQIPATDINNGIFHNFFAEEIEYPTWNANQRLPATIEIDSMPVFYGSVELMEVGFKNQLPQTYNVVFYGQIKNVVAQWGELTLAEVDWSTYDHTIDDATVESSWTGSLFSGDIIWDLKDYGNGFTYSTQANVDNNIRYGRGFTFRYLRPSIKLKAMVRHIFNEFGYEIGGSLFDRGEFTNLYVTPMNVAGPFVDFLDEQYGEFEAINPFPFTIFPSANQNNTWATLPIGTNVISNPSGSWNASLSEYTIPRDGDYTFRITMMVNSADPIIPNHFKLLYNGKMVDQWSGNDAYIDQLVLSVKIPRCKEGGIVKVVYNAFKNTNIMNANIQCTQSPYSIQPVVVMANAFPDIKITDFINSVMQMCNAVIIPNGASQFDIYNIDDWYSLGVNKDYTTYVDFTQMTHKKMPIPSIIEMKHQEGESRPDKYFRDTYGRNYGSIVQKPDVDFANGELRVQTLFNVFPPQRMNRIDQLGVPVGDTDIDLPVILNTEYKPIQQKLILFYFQDFKNVTSQYQYNSNAKTYQPVSAPYTNTPTTGSSSVTCSFGLEGSIVGDIPTQTFYLNFWHTFISRLFSTKSRIVICTAYLPVGEWINMKLNDNIVVSGNYYKIQKIDYNLLTEEAKLELVTYPNVNKITISGSTGKKPVFNDPLLNADGITYMGGTQVKALLANSPISTSGQFVVSPLSATSFNDTLSSQVINLVDNVKKQSIINRVSIWSTATFGISLSPSPTLLTITDTGFEAEDGMYTTGMNSEITINRGGQYRVRTQITVGTHGGGGGGGGTTVVGEIQLNGITTEGYFAYSGSHTHTMTMETILSIPESGVVSTVMYTESGTVGKDIKRIQMTIERIY